MVVRFSLKGISAVDNLSDVCKNTIGARMTAAMVLQWSQDSERRRLQTIPKMFIRKYRENLSSPTFLKLPNDAKWKVELTKCNDEVWLQKGWKEFAKCYSLEQGHFVVFRYEGNSHFQVLIFDETATEIDCHSNSSHGREDGKFDEKYIVPNMEDDESDSSVLTVLPCRGDLT
ncbi:B3 domain-containing transcription factor VRN1-like [Quercus suber]|uniref:B3 domain-containing transcription factor VRN1-like n=1 Tax=Quercus suber TaxID=58331 RepID=UPI0032DEB9EA